MNMHQLGRLGSFVWAALALSLGVGILGSPAWAEPKGAGEPAPPPAVTPGDPMSGRGWLGVQIQPLDEGLREAFDFRKPGVLVGEVSPGSPAARAGIIARRHPRQRGR